MSDRSEEMERSVTGVLGSAQIKAELEAGRLMQAGTFDLKRLRPAGYDLVVARDGGGQVPNPANPDKPTKYKPGARFPEAALVLRPGDFAFVATKEKFCLPRNVAVNVAVKNGFARRGLLLLTGLLVDPGYGESEPTALHFGIANVSRQQLIVPFETEAIASIQFLPVMGEVDIRPAAAPADQDTLSGFVLFTRLERQVDKIDSKIDATNASIGTTLVLGAFVILATLVGSIVAILLGAISSSNTSAALARVIQLVKDNLVASVVLAVIAASVAVWLLSILLWPIGKLVMIRSETGRFEREQRKSRRQERRKLRIENRAELRRIRREKKIAEANASLAKAKSSSSTTSNDNQSASREPQCWAAVQLWDLCRMTSSACSNS